MLNKWYNKLAVFSTILMIMWMYSRGVSAYALSTTPSKTVYVKEKNGDETPVEKPEVNVKYDSYGRKIRTTNLPKNASLFPYIVEGVPNWVYEAVRVNKATPHWEVDAKHNTEFTPKQLFDSGTFDYDYWYTGLSEELMTRLNVDYRTLDTDKFARTMEQYYSPMSIESRNTTMYDLALSYCDFIKQHKIITKAEVYVLPETFWKGEFESWRCNAYVKFTILHQPTMASKKMYDEFGEMTKHGSNTQKVRPKENYVYEGLVQFAMNPGSSVGGGVSINYNTADILSQLQSERNLFGGAKPKAQPSLDIAKLKSEIVTTDIK